LPGRRSTELRQLGRKHPPEDGTDPRHGSREYPGLPEGGAFLDGFVGVSIGGIEEIPIPKSTVVNKYPPNCPTNRTPCT
jgi:hypothetical protein